MFKVTEPVSVPGAVGDRIDEPCKLMVSNDIPVVLARGSKCIGSATTYAHSGPSQNRYREVAIWLTPSGRFIAHRGRITKWQQEVSHLDIVEGECLEDIAPADWTPEEQEAFEEAHRALGLEFGRFVE